MSYFSYFPLTSVILNKDTVDIRQARNILVRAKFSDYLKTREGLYEEYQIRDGERPDTLAHKIYGRSELHWLILLFNEIIDPYYEWPMSYDELTKFIAYKYPGKAVYVDDTFYYDSGVNRNQRINQTEPIFETGTKARITKNSETRELNILSYDPLLMKMVIDDSGWLETGSPSNRGIDTRISVVNSKGNRIFSSIRYIENNDTSLHHFIDSNKDIINPRGKLDPVSDALGRTVRILLYSNPDDNIRNQSLMSLPYVTNADYEYSLNEEKRKINLLKPYFVNEALKQFSALFKNKTSGV